MDTKNIISFYDLSDSWQDEARQNSGDGFAEENSYLEPEPGQNPKEHILWDLSECMIAEGDHEGFIYNAVISISNNSAMLLYIDDAFETANIKFV